MASGTTVGGESARYCDTSILISFYNSEEDPIFIQVTMSEYSNRNMTNPLNANVYVVWVVGEVVKGW